MSDWGSGYVTDVEYGSAFFREQSPEVIRLTCLLNGVETPSVGKNFTYCELGCGEGLTTMVLAAANPEARFFGVDFNPVHIMRARAVARDSRLTNVEFLERSFEELVEDRSGLLPEMDFITLHGVYSWVSQPIRQAIVQFLGRYLKPGGLVYVSYNSMPGWALGGPVQRLLHDVGALITGRSDRKVMSAISLLEKLAAAEAKAFKGNHFVEGVLGVRSRSQERYLAHEYLNDHWNPMYFGDVARELEVAKLSYVGSASLMANFSELIVTAAQHEVVKSIDDVQLQETVKDMCCGRRFRQDVYIRGLRRMTSARQDALMRQVRLMLLVPRSEFKMKLRVLSGDAELQPVYNVIADALARGPQRVSDLLDLQEIRGKSHITPGVIVGVLVGSDQAFPILEPSESVDPAPALRLNACLIGGAREASPNSALGFACPTIMSGISCNLPEAYVLRDVMSGRTIEAPGLAQELLGVIKANGQNVLKDGAPIEDEAAALEFLTTTVRQITSNLVPIWLELWPQLRQAQSAVSPTRKAEPAAKTRT